MKLWQKVIAGLVLGFAIALITTWLMLDRIVQNRIESEASSALGVPAHIEKLKLDLFDGHLDINGMTIDNPEGFNAPFLIKIDKFELKLITSSLNSPTLDIQKFDLNGLEVNIEQKFINSNVAIIGKNLSRSKTDRESQGDRNEKKLKADRISISNISTNFFFSPLGGVVKPQVFTLPSLELKNLTSENAQGVVLSELVSKIVAEMFAAIAKQISSSFPKFAP